MIVKAKESSTHLYMRRVHRVYVSGPMRGIEDLNYPAFDTATARLRELGHEVFNPAERDRDHEEAFGGTGFEPPDLRRLLAEDLDWIARRADAIAVLPGWEKSLGARAEVALARALAIPIAPVEAFWPSGPDPRALL